MLYKSKWKVEEEGAQMDDLSSCGSSCPASFPNKRIVEEVLTP